LLQNVTKHYKHTTKIEVQKKYYSKTRQVLQGLGYIISCSDNSKQVFEKSNKRIISFIQSGEIPVQHNVQIPRTENQHISLPHFIAEKSKVLDSADLNKLKLKLLYLFKQAEQGVIKTFSLQDIYVNILDNNPSVNVFNVKSINPKDEYNKLLDLYTQHKIFINKPKKSPYNKNYIHYIAKKFNQYINQELALLPYVNKVYLFGSPLWEKAGSYQAPFVHYDWVKMASDFDILIEIDEDFLEEFPDNWEEKFFYKPPSAYYYHLGDMGSSQSLELCQQYPGVTFYQHLIEAYLFFPSKGDEVSKEQFLTEFNGKLLYSKATIKEILKKNYRLNTIAVKKFSTASHNRVYKITTSEKSYVYKIYNKNTSLYAGMAGLEIELLNQLKGSGLELSYPIASHTGKYIYKISGNECVLFEYLAGDISNTITHSQAVSAASLIARFHKASTNINMDFGERFSQNHIYKLWINNAIKFIQQGQMDSYTQEELSDLSLKLTKLKGIETFLHADVAPKNFKFTDSKCSLFDFEQVSQGLRIFDLIDGMIEFSMRNNQCQKEIASAFFNAYNQCYPLSEVQLSQFNDVLKIQIMAKITRLYRTHLDFNYELNTKKINGLKSCYSQLARQGRQYQ